MAPILLKFMPKIRLFLICGIISTFSWLTSKNAPPYSYYIEIIPQYIFLVAVISGQEFRNSDSDIVHMIPLLASIVMGIANKAGLITVIHVVLNELFPTDIRALSVGIVNTLENVVYMINAKLFPTMVYSWGFQVVMYLYTASSWLLTVWAWIALKNTEGKTLVEVEEMFSSVPRGKESSSVSIS